MFLTVSIFVFNNAQCVIVLLLGIALLSYHFLRKEMVEMPKKAATVDEFEKQKAEGKTILDYYIKKCKSAQHIVAKNIKYNNHEFNYGNKYVICPECMFTYLAGNACICEECGDIIFPGDIVIAVPVTIEVEDEKEIKSKIITTGYKHIACFKERGYTVTTHMWGEGCILKKIEDDTEQ